MIKKYIFLSKWRERLTDDNIIKYEKKSLNWHTCAIGDRIFGEFGVRHKAYKSSLSKKAQELGFEFNYAIECNDKEKALEILEKIENIPTIWKFESDDEEPVTFVDMENPS